MIRVRPVLSRAVGACLALTASACTSVAAPAGDRNDGAWGTARQVPAMAGAMLSYGSLACGAPDNCTLFYPTQQFTEFSVSEVHGVWGRSAPVPARPNSLFACTAPGDCVVAGGRAAVVSEVHGVWGRERPVPGLAGLAGKNFAMSALSCSVTGWCGAAGSYWPLGKLGIGNKSRPFVVSGHNGIWRAAQPRPGLTALKNGSHAWIAAMSCDPEGTCTAGGSFQAPSGGTRPFAVSERGGVWGPAHTMTGAPTSFADSEISAISCTSPGNCTAAGGIAHYAGSYPRQPFVVTETDGEWGQTRSLAGAATVSKGLGEVVITGLSCAAPGQCALTGYYTATGDYKYSLPRTVPFLASQVNGTWGAARQVPGLAALHPGRQAELTSVSCGSPGNCAAGGFYTTPGSAHAFLITETDGSWGPATPVPGLAARTRDHSAVDFVRCWPATPCIAVGNSGSPDGTIFVTTQR